MRAVALALLLAACGRDAAPTADTGDAAAAAAQRKAVSDVDGARRDAVMQRTEQKPDVSG